MFLNRDLWCIYIHIYHIHINLYILRKTSVSKDLLFYTNMHHVTQHVTAVSAFHMPGAALLMVGLPRVYGDSLDEDSLKTLHRKCVKQTNINLHWITLINNHGQWSQWLKLHKLQNLWFRAPSSHQLTHHGMGLNSSFLRVNIPFLMINSQYLPIVYGYHKLRVVSPWFYCNPVKSQSLPTHLLPWWFLWGHLRSRWRTTWARA